MFLDLLESFSSFIELSERFINKAACSFAVFHSYSGYKNGSFSKSNFFTVHRGIFNVNLKVIAKTFTPLLASKYSEVSISFYFHFSPAHRLLQGHGSPRHPADGRSGHSHPGLLPT